MPTQTRNLDPTPIIQSSHPSVQLPLAQTYQIYATSPSEVVAFSHSCVSCLTIIHFGEFAIKLFRQNLLDLCDGHHPIIITAELWSHKTKVPLTRSSLKPDHNHEVQQYSLCPPCGFWSFGLRPQCSWASTHPWPKGWSTGPSSAHQYARVPRRS